MVMGGARAVAVALRQAFDVPLKLKLKLLTHPTPRRPIDGMMVGRQSAQPHSYTPNRLSTPIAPTMFLQRSAFAVARRAAPRAVARRTFTTSFVRRKSQQGSKAIIRSNQAADHHCRRCEPEQGRQPLHLFS